MKYLTLLSLLFSSTALSFVVLPTEHTQEVFGVNDGKHVKFHAALEEDHSSLRLIQTSPSETRWVTEEDKLELKRVCLHQ